MELSAYLDALVARTRAQLGSSLVAVSLVGSAGAGWYEPGVSDLDVAVVVEGRLEETSARALAAQVRHSSLPCPARRLELVVYRRDVLARAEWPLPFELNLNTGADMEDHLALDPSEESAHWFLLDLSIGRERSTPLVGPPLRHLVGEIGRASVLEALRLALDWYEAEEPDPVATILAACRSWYYADRGEWASKREAAEWAAGRLPDGDSVQRALRVRAGDGAEPPGAADAAAVLAPARAALDAG